MTYQSNNQDVSAVASDLVAGAIDSALTLSRHASTSQSVQTTLDRARRLVILARSCTSDGERADWLRCTSATAYNAAIKYWKEEDWKAALGLARSSCEFGSEALDMAPDEDKTKPGWVQLETGLAKRYELLAACQFKLSDKKVSPWFFPSAFYVRKNKAIEIISDSQGAVAAYFSALAHTPSSVVQQIEKDSKTASPFTIISALSDVSSCISRLAPTILSEVDAISSETTVFLHQLDRLPMSVKGALVEQIMDLLGEASYKIEVAQVCLVLGDWLLGLYNISSMPIRRLRCVMITFH